MELSFRARLLSRAGPVCRDLGTPVKRNENQLCDYMTTGLNIFHVIVFTGPARQTETTKKLPQNKTAHLTIFSLNNKELHETIKT